MLWKSQHGETVGPSRLLLIGLIAHLTDSALQEDIARSTRRLLQLGQDILSGRRDIADQAGDLR
ncbi:hypothetical protein [Paraburkholderia domus]|jgi:hypothetical protein|uniref:hypothetical protein n=1 Tax=Paraburkholderia domus TaxID=2793075 RepID=UPI001911303A|nr:hypothetical protein [Paraburkholderia domus]MBK5186100.1 hypothetical protein [Burkholderia sp. R-69749]CAE6900529.1 hypothetical protein R69749_08124 [Paraburkholderia domus]